MHETRSPLFIGHIDDVARGSDAVAVAGWIVCQDESLEPPSYRAGGTDFATNLTREDVAQCYNTTKRSYLVSGFDIIVPAAGPRLAITAMVEGTELPLFDLELPPDIRLSTQRPPQLLVVDDFYDDPDSVRNFALRQDFAEDLRFFKGQRTLKTFRFPGIHERFQCLLQAKVTRWSEMEVNGVFQFCTAKDPLVYHADTQMYAGAVYLTPNAPAQCGTSFFRSRTHTDVRRWPIAGHTYDSVFPTGHYDRTKFELVDIVGNVYNRLVIWDAQLLHSASEYFGDRLENSRLFHLFFFDVEPLVERGSSGEPGERGAAVGNSV